MDEYEIARSGGLYRSEVIRAFKFLIDEFGFEAPVKRDGKYSYAISYEHPDAGVAVILSNAYHPVDYGFEITLDPLGQELGDERNVVFFTLKEDQDREYRFLSSGAEALRSAVRDLAATNNSFKPKG